MVGLVIRARTAVGIFPSGSYVASHHVAPFTSVPGAMNDYVDLGSSAWAAAVSSGTPTNFGTALARAQAPNKVRLRAGEYGGPYTGNRWIPSFAAAATNSNPDNPLVFFTENPAAAVSVYGTPSLYSTLRKVGTPFGTDNPVLGVLDGNTRNHIVFDGFHVNEADALSAPNGGIFQLAATTGLQYRRCAITRGNGTLFYAAGHNANPFYAEGCINCAVLDCMLDGFVRRSDGVIHQNNSSLEVYNSTGLLVMNNDFQNFGYGLFQKESDNQWSTTGAYRYNRFTNGGLAINVQQGSLFECDHNLAIDVDTGFHGDGGPVTYAGGVRPPQVLNVHHDTYIIRSTPFITGGARGAIIIENGMQLRTSTMRDMIVYSRAGWADRHFQVDAGGSSSWGWNDWAVLNRNLYYREGGGTPTFMGLAFNGITGLVNWQTETGREANSIVSDPQFVNAAANDFRLASNGQAALTASSTGGRLGAFETGNEEIGRRANPVY